MFNTAVGDGRRLPCVEGAEAPLPVTELPIPEDTVSMIDGAEGDSISMPLDAALPDPLETALGDKPVESEDLEPMVHDGNPASPVEADESPDSGIETDFSSENPMLRAWSA